VHEEVHAALRVALPTAFRLLLPILAQNSEPHVRIERRGTGWFSGYVPKPNFLAIVAVGQEELTKLGSPCLEAIKRHHPQYLGLVGSASTGRRLLFQDPASLLRGLVYRHAFHNGTDELNNEQVEKIIRDFESFIDDPCLSFRYIVELQKFNMDADGLSLPEGLTIRRLSDDEVSELHGGPYWSSGTSESLFYISGYAVVAEIVERKIFGGDPVESTEFAKLTTKLDRVLLAFRTFKSGQTGLNAIQVLGSEIGGRSSFGRIGDLPIPRFGPDYHLNATEIQQFLEHAAHIFSELDPALELACSRLSDAEARNRPQDRLLDAVIGLEAILLVSVGTDDRRGELSNRFSLNFSTLFDGAEERFRQYLIARDMYRHRSIIAHGGSIEGTNLRVGDERVSLDEAAYRACAMLRLVIKRFLPQETSPDFRIERWWEKQLFGLG